MYVYMCSVFRLRRQRSAFPCNFHFIVTLSEKVRKINLVYFVSHFNHVYGIYMKIKRNCVQVTLLFFMFLSNSVRRKIVYYIGTSNKFPCDWTKVSSQARARNLCRSKPSVNSRSNRWNLIFDSNGNSVREFWLSEPATVDVAF